MSLSGGSFCLVCYSEYVFSFQPTKSIRNWRIDVKPLKTTFAITLKAYTLLVATPFWFYFFSFDNLTISFFSQPNRVIQKHFIVKSIKLNGSPEFRFMMEIILQFRHALLRYNRHLSGSVYTIPIWLQFFAFNSTNIIALLKPIFSIPSINFYDSHHIDFCSRFQSTCTSH